MLMRPRILVAVLAMLAAVSSGAADKPQFLNSPQSLKADRPFSDAVRAGDFLFLSGAIGGDPATGELPEGIEPQARLALKHIQKVLETNGSSLGDVVKCTVFLADIAEWPAFNNVYREFFKKPYPARSAFAASGLALNARVELECMAYSPQKRTR